MLCVHACAAGTTRLLDMARQYSVQNFVYASSSSVYGCSDRQVLQEADAVEKPVSPYAATKKACEVSCSPRTLFSLSLPPPSLLPSSLLLLP
jgi:nucleoside-diphosphate-sugar epimerase